MIGVGDLVVCVDDGPCRVPNCACGGAPTELVQRRVYRVLDLIDPWPPYWSFYAVDIGLPPRRNHSTQAGRSFNVARFRKLNDSYDDAKLIERIKSCKPHRVPTETTVTVDRDGRAWMGEAA